MDQKTRDIINKRFRISSVPDLENRLEEVKEKLTYIGFDTKKDFRAFPVLNSLYALYQGASQEFVKEEGIEITNFSQLENYLKKYVGKESRLDYEQKRRSYNGVDKK